MVLSAEVRKERRRAKAAPLFHGSVGAARRAARGTSSRAAGGRRPEASGSAPKPKVPEPEVTKQTFSFEELVARRAREEAVRFDGCTVYCAKHLYTINDEMCSTCAKKGWRDTRGVPYHARGRRTPH